MQLGMQYAEVVGAKRSTHTVYLANMGGGDRYLYCKKVKPHAVRTAYLLHTVYLTASSHFWVILTQPDILSI